MKVILWLMLYKPVQVIIWKPLVTHWVPDNHVKSIGYCKKHGTSRAKKGARHRRSAVTATTMTEAAKWDACSRKKVCAPLDTHGGEQNRAPL